MKRIFAILFAVFLVFEFSATNAYAEDDITIIDQNKEIVSEAINMETKLLDKNYNKNVKIDPIYIVIHETGNRGVGADADAHYIYWNKDEEAERSTHFVVDENKIVQLLPLDAMGWHVGDNKGHSDIKNINSIGIEICVNEDGDYESARQRTIRLVKYLMRTLNIDDEHVVRHFDASGKLCPETMLKYPELWDDFKLRIKEPDLIFDDFIPSMILYQKECHSVNYNDGNSLLENKLDFKRFNINNTDYYFIKHYANRSWNFDFTDNNIDSYNMISEWFNKRSRFPIDIKFINRVNTLNTISELIEPYTK